MTTATRKGGWLLGILVALLHLAAWLHADRLMRTSASERADLLLDALVESAEQTLQASHYLEERISSTLRGIAVQVASHPEIRTFEALRELAKRHDVKVIAVYDCHGRLLVSNASETLDPELPSSFGCHDLLSGDKTEHTFGFSAGIFCEADAFGIALRLPEGGLVRVLADVGFVLGFEKNVGLAALVDRFRRHPDIQSLDLLDMKGTSLLPASASTTVGGGVRAVSRPLSIHGSAVGRFELVLADQGLLAFRRTTGITILLSGLLALLVLVLFQRWAARSEDARERQRQLTELQRRSDGLARVVSGVAHEIRNPLNTLALGIDSLRAGLEKDGAVPGSRQLERLELLKKTVGDANAQVQSLLQSTRPVVPQMRPFDLESWIRDFEMAFATTFPQCRLEIDPALPVPIATDPDLLRRLLWNLVANAAQAKASRVGIRGGPPAGTDGERIAWCVRDDGPGLPEPVRDNLFMPGVTTRVEGSGLGLYNAHRLAISLDGSLDLESTGSTGTCFSLTLPHNPVPEPVKGSR